MNLPPPPASRSTFAKHKYDRLKSECGFNIYIVGFAHRALRAGRTSGGRNDEVVRDASQSAVVGKVRSLISISK